MASLVKRAPRWLDRHRRRCNLVNRWPVPWFQGRESMAGMGYVSRAYDKLPDWVKLTLGLCAIVAIIYGVAREGWVFLLKVIFSPEP